MYLYMTSPTSFRLEEENLAKLKALAKRQDVSTTKILNRIISRFSSPDKMNSDEKVVQNDEMEILKKELSSQRQRMNVLQNQVDFVIKQSKNAKGGNR